MSSTLEFRDPRKVLAEHGLRPKRGYSQNFLCSRHAVDAIAAAVAKVPSALVVELGPGLGTLTAALLAQGLKVLGIERDPDMLAVLERDFAPHGLQLRRDDAAHVDYAALAAEHGASELCVVGNIPYALTGAILRNLVQSRGVVARALLMVQREVRDRLQAAPGSAEYGALTVFTSAAFSASTLLKLAPTVFHPPPKVHSAVVLLERREHPLAEETEAFSRTVRAVFQGRRKTLRNALGSAWPETAVELALAACGLDPKLRGENLDPTQFGALAAALERAAP
ncbi:MAG TPA: 16S rRNA (adenine(1518)-N(6)/adenine(1519)-N(6))-dimethyltransferase RsmA [Polyangiales bacterium]|nr:16S rRNA (adenine(1518)-N(6)/adenine(1519)-N(6))-dimethyltransferase RsmA [Polyangiales bacterium]